MADVFSIRWRKNPSESEKMAREIIEGWQDKNIHYDMIFSAVIEFEGKTPITESGITRYLGQLADKFTKLANRFESVDFTTVGVAQTQDNVVMEFDKDFDDAMLGDWDD